MKLRHLLPLILLLLVISTVSGADTVQRIIFRSAMDAPTDDPDFQQNPQRYFELYTMNPDGSGIAQLTHAEPGDVNADPSFSNTAPSKILYIHSSGLSGSFDMYMMNGDGTENTLMLAHGDQILAINDPMYSPDDKMIVFGAKIRVSEEGNPIYNIYTLNPADGELTPITHDDGESDVIPQYSPDGTMIAYYTYVWTSDGNTHRIRVTDLNKGEETILSKYPWESGPSWYTVEAPAQETQSQKTSTETQETQNSIPGYPTLSLLLAVLMTIILKQVKLRHHPI
jgi:hypothetical protein